MCSNTPNPIPVNLILWHLKFDDNVCILVQTWIHPSVHVSFYSVSEGRSCRLNTVTLGRNYSMFHFRLQNEPFKVKTENQIFGLLKLNADELDKIQKRIFS